MAVSGAEFPPPVRGRGGKTEALVRTTPSRRRHGLRPEASSHHLVSDSSLSGPFPAHPADSGQFPADVSSAFYGPRLAAFTVSPPAARAVCTASRTLPEEDGHGTGRIGASDIRH